MKSIWTDKEFIFHHTSGQYTDNFEKPANSIGEILQTGLMKMEEAYPSKSSERYNRHQRLEYHCLGDPSMPVFWGADYGLEESLNIHYQPEDKEIIVSTGGNRHYYIGFMESYSKRVGRYYGNYVRIPCTAPDETWITVYKPGGAAIRTYAYPGYGNKSEAYEVSIKSMDFNLNNELVVEIDNLLDMNLVVRITESNNFMHNNSTDYKAKDNIVTHSIKQTNNRLFFVSLLNGDEIIDTKTIYNRN